MQNDAINTLYSFADAYNTTNSSADLHIVTSSLNNSTRYIAPLPSVPTPAPFWVHSIEYTFPFNVSLRLQTYSSNSGPLDGTLRIDITSWSDGTKNTQRNSTMYVSRSTFLPNGVTYDRRQVYATNVHVTLPDTMDAVFVVSEVIDGSSNANAGIGRVGAGMRSMYKDQVFINMGYWFTYHTGIATEQFTNGNGG